jgi:hypothetical protein
MKSFLLSVFILLNAVEPSAQSEWTLVKAIDDLEVFTRSTVESKFKEVKINAKIQCSMSEIVAVLEDIDAQKKWVMRTLEVDMLEQRNAGDFTYYLITDMPFPVRDRELIVDHKRTLISENQVKIELLTSEYILTPHAEYVLIPYYSSTYLMKQSEDGWIDIHYHVKLDPGGILPAWLYNLAVAKGPISSFQGLFDIIHSGAYRDRTIVGLN